MPKKKWLVSAAAVAAIGGTAGYVLTRVKASPEKATELLEEAKEKLQRSDHSTEEAAAELETVGS